MKLKQELAAVRARQARDSAQLHALMIGLIKEALLLACSQETSPRRANLDFNQHLKTASQMREFLWRNVLLNLPKKPKSSCQPQTVQKIGGGAISESVEQVLGLGPKYSVAP
ncbi:hypothetical protein MTO96_038894 [Rhipicephalus appendiculatus]